MLAQVNTYELNLLGKIQMRTVTKTDFGEAVESWADVYTSVYMKRLPPRRGSEVEENRQTVGVQSDSFVIRKENRTPTAADYRIVYDSKNYYITGVRPYKTSLDYIVLDTELRDNESSISELTALTFSPVGSEDQSKSSGEAIDPITITADQPSIFTTTDMPSELTLTVNSVTEATITGTSPMMTTQFTIVALGKGGGVVSKAIDLTISGVGGTLWKAHNQLGSSVVLLNLDASEDDADYITVASSRISQWDDNSGNNNHAVQTIGSRQPYLLDDDPQKMNNRRVVHSSKRRDSLVIDLGASE
ncbi:MAG: head-tail adaptor protein, partial [Bacteroidota bacterium]